MTEKDDAAIPAWQRNQPDTASDTTPSNDDTGVASEEAGAEASHDPSDELDVARRFLEDEEVKASPREKKVEFLKAKGIKDDDIAKLLTESPPSSTSSAIDISPESSSPVPAHSTALSSTADRPPIVTYPEFLTKPTRQPPLVTTAALLTTASTLAGFAALIHGTSRYLLTPMLESQTDARLDFHATTASRLDSLVSRLEGTVSTVPPKKPSPSADLDSEADDPTELFHRDVGTQTANVDEKTTAALAAQKPPPPSSAQADTLNSLARTLTSIKDGIRSQSEDLEDVKTLVDVFRDDLDAMVYGGNNGGPYDFSSGGGAVSFGYGSSAKKNEPDDEIKKVKDSVRRVKGALLSTRSFPASTV